MKATWVRSLKITTFRRFKDVAIHFGPNVTLIAGQNGTSKSTLLGMLAQPFSFGVVRGRTAGSPDQSAYIKTYHGEHLDKYVDLAGRYFMYDCDNVFRLSKRYDTNSKDYQYYTVLENIDLAKDSPLADKTLFTRNRKRRTEKGVRFVTGPGASHKLGEGNFPHPVIYLGLNRLWPLANAKKCSFTSDALSKEDKEWYVHQYNEILCLDEYRNNAKFMHTTEKRKSITPESNNYDGESCSAGQDNIGQLLTAILSFGHLKKKLGSRYQGGMLLIDELDATLHAHAQTKLLQLLCRASEELGLQVISTTHSLVMLEKAYHSSLRKKVKVLYLANEDNMIIEKTFSTYQEIRDHLNVQSSSVSEPKPPKVSVVVEDEEGRDFFKAVCGSRLRNFVDVKIADRLGAGQLKNLATLSCSLPELRSLILVPDGDMASSWRDRPNNLIALPGEARPETLVYRHLFSLRDSDPLWNGVCSTYTKQFAITKCGGDSSAKGDDKLWVKKWYKNQSEHWGRNNQKVFRSWVQWHKPECLAFCTTLLKLLKGRYRGGIPDDVIKRTLAPLEAR